jgi:hypothetical protein
VHPLVVMIGIIAGGQLAGILGVLLAAPTLATFRVLGRYVLRRLYDRDPFVESVGKEEAEKTRPKPTMVKKAGEAALDHLKRKVKQAAKRNTEGSDSTGTSRQ